MKIEVHNDNGTITTYNINKEDFTNSSLENHLGYINSKSKEKNVLNIIKAYYSNSKIILFDETNQIISKKLEDLKIKEFNSDNNTKTIFDEKDFSMIFFTSGSTGNPVGALKTKKHLEEEVKVLTKLFENKNINKVVLTVPFVHIYGMLFGLLYPLLNNIDIVLKEHFLPNDLLNLIDDNSLVVTTPLYIKALNKISSQKDLSKAIFVSSTAPLDALNAKEFKEKFNTDIMQIFGSTETGGIAYKLNDANLWTPMPEVKIETNENNELKVISPFVSTTLYENEFKDINGIMQTFDYIEKENEKFKLVGRSSQILKIAGKRYSTIQIENILEEVEEINKALVFVSSNEDSLREERLDITIESSKEFSSKEIKKILQNRLSNLKFSLSLKYVDKIPTSSVGKKLRV
ncbi:AMP-binding protein [Halarcobacter bivalviorum]|uniref:AMP-binding protein n=1 Tax=Halarcobacter bivalviorum TaxID=663364 RepID=UPI00100B84EA|nr:AMP-binding protein [Halarcobacter bivalviorum]RXK05728.1 aconitate hydratase [Halarcobacter bivalviorum]